MSVSVMNTVMCLCLMLQTGLGVRIANNQRVEGNSIKVIGQNNVLVGDFITAIGNNLKVTGNNADVTGNNAKITGNNGKIIGGNARIQGKGKFIVLGNNANVEATEVEVKGNNARITAQESKIFGNNARVEGHSVIVGNNARITGDNSVITGNNGHIQGNNAQITGINPTAIGNNADICTDIGRDIEIKGGNVDVIAKFLDINGQQLSVHPYDNKVHVEGRDATIVSDHGKCLQFVHFREQDYNYSVRITGQNLVVKVKGEEVSENTYNADGNNITIERN